jgi:branched-subunit amino acid transport protein AzlD
MELFWNFQTTLQNVSSVSGLGIGVLVTILVLAAIGVIALCVTTVLIFKRIVSPNADVEQIPDEVVVAIAAAYHRMKTDAGISDSLVAAIASAYHFRQYPSDDSGNGVTEAIVAAIVYAYHYMKTSKGVSDDIAAAIALSFHTLKTAR